MVSWELMLKQGAEAAYIDPNALVGVDLARINIELGLGVELSDYKSQHVLATTEEDFTSRIIRSSLVGVEAFKGILLGSLRIALMGLQEGRVKEEDERAKNAGGVIVLGLAAERQQAGTAENSDSYSSIERFDF